MNDIINKVIQIILLSLLFIGYSNAQNNAIFAGGDSDGFDVGSFRQEMNNSIFTGGNGDGFHIVSIQQTLNNSIFAGGIGDGFDIATTQAQLLNNAIFAGGIGDGFDEISIIVDPADLPVELLYFEGENEGEMNLLSWATATELNNDYFILERSFNGIDFEEVIEVNGAGTTSIEQSYQHEDPILPLLGNPVVYYRLLQVDFDDTEHYSKIIVVELPSDMRNTNFAIFPNPAIYSITIILDGVDLTENAEIMIIGVNGGILRRISITQDKLQGGYQLDISKLPNGQYYIMVRNGENQWVEPMIKSRT